MKMNMGMMKRSFGSLQRGAEPPMMKQKMKSKNPPRKFGKKKK